MTIYNENREMKLPFGGFETAAEVKRIAERAMGMLRLVGRHSNRFVSTDSRGNICSPEEETVRWCISDSLDRRETYIAALDVEKQNQIDQPMMEAQEKYWESNPPTSDSGPFHGLILCCNTAPKWTPVILLAKGADRFQYRRTHEVLGVVPPPKEVSDEYNFWCGQLVEIKETGERGVLLSSGGGRKHEFKPDNKTWEDRREVDEDDLILLCQVCHEPIACLMLGHKHKEDLMWVCNSCHVSSRYKSKRERGGG